jgi:DNA-binding transcriptional LysR family regulator
MESSDLRFFEVVAQTQNITRAARILNTVQSNVTGRIKRLEEELGTQLLTRNSRGVSLTTAGTALLPFAVRVRQLLDEASDSVGKNPSQHVDGVLRIGTIETIAAVHLPPVLIRYSELFPKVEVVLRTGTSRELRDEILSHRLDGAFVGGLTGHESLQETVLWEDELVLVGPASFHWETPLRSMSEVRVLVFRTGCSYRSYLEEFLTNSGIHAVRQIELGTLEGILGCVSAGLGITLLPRRVVEPSVYRGRLSIHELPGRHAVVPTVFIHRNDSYVGPALRHFVATAVGEPKPAARALAV